MPVKSWLKKLRRRRSSEHSLRRQLDPQLGVMRLEPRRVLSATINEVHYDPAADANGDGTVEPAQDQFVEFVNNSGGPLDISGWTLSDNTGVRHEFANGTTLDDGQAAVVFGGGTPTGAFGGSEVVVASSGELGLDDTSDTITLLDADGVVVATMSYEDGDASGESLTRDPDVTGMFQPHSTADEDDDGSLFSPGTQIDGSTFEDNYAPQVTVDTLITNDTTPPLSGTVNDPAATVQVELNGETYSATNNMDGTWTLADDTIDPALAEGTYDVTVTAEDTSGNTDSITFADALTIDTTAPATPSKPELVSLSFGNKTLDTTPTLQGTAEANSTVTVFINESPNGPLVQQLQTTANGLGFWEVTADILGLGTYRARAQATDAAGNVSGLSQFEQFEVIAENPVAMIQTPTLDPNAKTVVVQFDRPVQVATISSDNFTLIRNDRNSGPGGTPISLAGVAVTPLDLDIITMSATQFAVDLSDLTRDGGTFTLTLNGSDGVLDVFGNEVLDDATVTWQQNLLNVRVVGGELFIEDLTAEPANDDITVRRDGANLVVESSRVLISETQDGNTLAFSFASIDQIHVDGGFGDDRLNVLFSGGDPVPMMGIDFDGQEQSSAGDLLRVVGNGATDTAVYTPDAITMGSGTVVVNGDNEIRFEGLEPVDIENMATATLALPGGDDVLTLTNGMTSGTMDAIVVSGTSGGVGIEAAAFRNNTNVVIDTTTVMDGNDSITVASADNNHLNTNLDLITGTGTDSISLVGAIAVSGSVMISSSGSVTDGAVDAVTDISATTLTINLTGGSVGTPANRLDVSVTNLNVDTSSGNGNISIEEAGGLSTLDLNAGGGNITLLAGGTITDGDASLDIQATTATVTLSTGDFGAAGGGDNSIDTAVDHLNVDTSTGNGSQWIDENDGLMSLDLDAGSGDITLDAGGTITDGDASLDIQATTVTATLGSGNFGATGGGDNSIDTAVDHLIVDTTAGNGSQWIDETDGLMSLDLDAGSGDITLDAAGTITDGDASLDIQATTVTATLSSGNFGASGGGNNSIDTAVDHLNVDTSTGNGSQWIDETDGLMSLDLNAGSGDITLDAGATITDGDAALDIQAATATVTLGSGDFGAMGGGNNSIDTAVDHLNVDTSAGNGSQWIDETDGLVSLDLNAGSGNVTLDAGATITDGDASLDIQAATATVTLGSGNFGATGGGNNSIDTAVTNLNVDTSAGDGSQWIDETDSLSTLDLNAGSGNVTLEAGGSVVDSDGDVDIEGNEISVSLSAAGTIGTAAMPLQIDGVTLDAETDGAAGDDIFVDDVAGGRVATTLTAGVVAGDTMIALASTAGLPTAGNFRIQIGNEILLVTSVSGSNLTVTRGDLDTTAAGYAAGTAVQLLVPADATSLSTGVTAGDTTVSVVDASLLPSNDRFQILVGGEVMTVTAVSGNNLTVVRGEGGTTAAMHSAGALVEVVGVAVGTIDAGAGNVTLTAFGTIVDDGVASTRIVADDLTMVASNIGVIEDFHSAAGTPVQVQLSGQVERVIVDDSDPTTGNLGDIFLEFDGNFSAAEDAFVVDASGLGQALVRASGNIGTQAAGSFQLSPGDNLGLDAGQTLTIEDNGLNVGNGDLFLGGQDIVDGASSVLNANIDAITTTITVADASPFPASPNFLIAIDSEVMEVTNIVGNTFTVVRAQAGTVAAPHLAGADVLLVSGNRTLQVSAENLIVRTANTGGDLLLNTDVQTVNLQVTNNNVTVDNVSGSNLQVLSVDAVGDITLMADQAIVDATTGTPSIRIHGTLTLEAASIGASGSTLDVAAADIDATATAGGIFINSLPEAPSGVITSLSGNINAVTGTVTVTSAAALPASGNFLVQVNGEIMLVTGVSGNDLTVLRGQAGTTASAHSAGDSVQQVVTVTTTLDGMINSTQTSLTVDDASVLPAAGPYRIAVGSEIMLVTGATGNTLTVVRGHGGTTATAHADGAAVNQLIPVAVTLETLASGEIQFDQNLNAMGPIVTRDVVVQSASSNNGTVTLRTSDGEVLVVEGTIAAANDLVGIAAGHVLDGPGGLVQSDQLVLYAQEGVGLLNNAGEAGLNTQVNQLAALTETGGISISNSTGNLELFATTFEGQSIDGLDTPTGRLPAKAGDPRPSLTTQVDTVQQGEVVLTATAGDTNGVNYDLVLDWCDDTVYGAVPCDGTILANTFPPPDTDREQVPLFNNAQQNSFNNAYLDNPGNEGDPIFVRFRIDVTPDIELVDNGEDLTSNEDQVQLNLDSFFSPAVIEPTPEPPPEFAAPVGIEVQVAPAENITLLATQTVLEASSGTSAGEQRERVYELRIVLADGSETEGIQLSAEILQRLEEEIRKLPNDVYRLYLIREDGTEELVREFEIRDGRIREAEIQFEFGEAGEEEEKDEDPRRDERQEQRDAEPSDAEPRGESGDVRPDGGGTQPEDPAAAEPALEQLELNPSRPLGAATLRGAAAAGAAMWLARGRSGSWDKQVDAALCKQPPARLGTAARLWKRVARRP